jgi:hypothetical protein
VANTLSRKKCYGTFLFAIIFRTVLGSMQLRLGALMLQSTYAFTECKTIAERPANRKCHTTYSLRGFPFRMTIYTVSVLFSIFMTAPAEQVTPPRFVQRQIAYTVGN